MVIRTEADRWDDTRNQGALEREAGLSSVFREARQLLSRGLAPELQKLLDRQGNDSLSLSILERAAAEFDLDIYALLNKTTKAWAAAMVNTYALLAPDVIILGGAVHQVVAQFGLPRTAFVLVNTIREKDWDGRISHDNKAWAKRVPIYPDVDAFGQNKRLKYVVDCNAGLTDIFVNILRREYRQQEQSQQVKPSVRDKLKVQPKRNSPKISANSIGQER